MSPGLPQIKLSGSSAISGPPKIAVARQLTVMQPQNSEVLPETSVAVVAMESPLETGTGRVTLKLAFPLTFVKTSV